MVGVAAVSIGLAPSTPPPRPVNFPAPFFSGTSTITLRAESPRLPTLRGHWGHSQIAGSDPGDFQPPKNLRLRSENAAEAPRRWPSTTKFGSEFKDALLWRVRIMPKIENQPTSAEPFADDAEYLEAIVNLAVSVVERFDAQRHPPNDSRHAAVVEHLIRQERNIKEQIAARVEATRSSGRVLALDKMKSRLDLSCLEHAVVKLLAAVALDRIQVLDGGTLLGPSVAEVLDLLGLGVADRIRSLAMFRPTGRLVRHGLMHVEPGADGLQPSVLMGAWLSITNDALEAAAGLRDIEDIEAPADAAS